MIEITKEEIEAISRSLKAGDYQFRKPKTIEKLIAHYRASEEREKDIKAAISEIDKIDERECSIAVFDHVCNIIGYLDCGMPEPPTNKGRE